MSSYCNYCDIISQIKRLNKGDTVYLISDILELSKQARAHDEHFDRDVFIDSILDIIGEDGTLLIPTFNWDFCKGIPFDYHKTVSKAGALGNAALKRSDFVRTKHPIYSFAVWGKDKTELFKRDYPNSFGINSIFDYLLQKDAKALVINLHAMDGLTLLHHAEEMMTVPYRYQKTFTADYIDWNGNTSVKSYTMYVRDLDMDAEEKTTHFSELLEELGIVHTQTINSIPFRTVLLRPAYTLMTYDIQYNHCRNLYSYKGQGDTADE